MKRIHPVGCGLACHRLRRADAKHRQDEITAPGHMLLDFFASVF